MNTRLRAVGGPLHGQVIQCTGDNYLMSGLMAHSAKCTRPTYSEGYSPVTDAYEYQRRTVNLGSVRVEVFAARDLTDQQFERRVADLIEGT